MKWIKASSGKLPDKDWVGVCKFKPIGSSLSPEVVFTNAAYVKHRANEYPSFEFEWLDESDPVEKDLESSRIKELLFEIELGFGSALAVFKEAIITTPENHPDPTAINDCINNARDGYESLKELTKLLSQPDTGWISEPLIEKFKKVGCASFPEAEEHSAKQCASLCVEEMIGFGEFIREYCFKDETRDGVEIWLCRLPGDRGKYTTEQLQKRYEQYKNESL